MSINTVSYVLVSKTRKVPHMSLVNKDLFTINESVTSNLTLHHNKFKIIKQQKSYKCTSKIYRRWARKQRSILNKKGREIRRNKSIRPPRRTYKKEIKTVDYAKMYAFYSGNKRR